MSSPAPDRPGTDFNVIVIGGGPAGLQAALTLGRVHRRTLLLDSGSYRNDPAGHMHNFLGHDGTPPAELRAAARRDLAEYDTVRIRDEAARAVRADGDGFAVDLAAETVTARGVILATGVRDTLPDVPGLSDLFGDLVAHCPFCHGHEYAGRRVGVLGDPEHLRGILAPVASEVIGLDPDSVERVERAGDGLRVLCRDGSSEELGGLFVTPTFAQAAPFAEQLGLTQLSSGCIEVDAMGRTSRPGVHAAGDLAHSAVLPMPMASVLMAAAAGQLAASSMIQHLMTAGS